MSRKKIFSLMVSAAAAVGIFAGGAAGQTAPRYPFPMEAPYPNGIRPAQTGLNSAKTQAWYNTWKTRYLRNCANKGIMPTADNDNLVKVEGVGWALIAAAYMGDKETFDGIYQFYEANVTTAAGNMMSWKTTCQGVHSDEGSGGSATDGDLDVAFGLVVASWQWPDASENYLDKAKYVITQTEKLITQCEGVSVLAGGFHNGNYGGTCGTGMSGGNDYTDLSYYFPAYFRVFAEVTGKELWNKLADDTYIHLARNAHATTGLVSGWQNTVNGNARAGASGNAAADSVYNHDASRVPWRIALDYLWYGTPAAKEWLTKITNWVVADNKVSGNTRTLVEGYNRNGTPTSSEPAGFAFMGAWAVGAMAQESENVRSTLWNYAASRTVDNENYWYHMHLGNMYLLTLSGNMWNEAMVGGDGFLLTTSIDGRGTVGRLPNAVRYAAGTPVTLTPNPEEGYVFDSWVGDGITGANNKNNPLTVTVNGAMTITAKFVLGSDGTNLLKDGNFPDGSVSTGEGMSWQLGQGQYWGDSEASFTHVSNGVRVSITAVGANKWEPQLIQKDVPLVNGITYVLTFKASASAARDIEVQFGGKDDPWPTYGDTTITLTTTLTDYRLEFTMEHASDEYAQFAFNMGQTTGEVTVSDVLFIVKSSGANIANVKGKTVRAAPLVSIRGRTLSVSGTRDSRVQIRVVNVAGKTVRKFNVRGGADISLRKVPAGAYIIEARRVKDGHKTTSRVTLK